MSKNPFIIQSRRLGNASDPFLPITEVHKIDSNGKVLLSEVPDSFTKVVVSGDNRDWFEIKNGIPNVNQFLVNYNQKTVTFNEANIGKQLQFSFTGTGVVFVSADNIYTDQVNGTVTETLADVIRKGEQAIENIASVEEIIEDGNVAIENINNKTQEIQTIIDGADARIADKISEIEQNANTSISDKLTDLQSQYGTKELEWDGEIDTKLNSLDDAIQSANTTIVNVDEKATLADQKITELQGKIDGADSQIADKITEIDGKGTTAITNKMTELDSTFDTQMETWTSEVDSKKGEVDTKISEIDTEFEQWQLAEQSRATKENERNTAESARIDNENARINAEQERIDSESLRESAELTRQSQESQRQTDTQVAIQNVESATSSANEATTSATNAAQFANEKGNYANQQGQFANEKAILANEKAELIDIEIETLSQLKTDVQSATSNANTSATEAQTQANYAKIQGDYSKVQGEYAKSQGDLINDILDNGSVQSVNGFTGVVTLTANDVNAYSKSETDNKIAEIVDSAPETLNTLKELAHALGEDPNFSVTVMSEIGKKVDKITGKQLSTEDYTSAEKSKLTGIEEDANKYIHPETHPATMIVEDASHRFVTDSKISEWDSKETVEGSQGKANQAETNAKNASVAKTQVGVAGGVARLNTEGKVVDQHGNEVEGKVKSVNNIEPDETGNITIPTFSGNYSDLTNKPFIPTKASQITDDVGLANDSDITNINNKIGLLSELETTEKEELVKAINEVNRKPTFNGDYNNLTNQPDLTQYATVDQLNAKTPVLKSTANFNSTTGTIIPHTIGHTNYHVRITPTQNPNGYLGEVWYEKSATSFKVCNSGTATTSFTYDVVIYYG